jgi:hypothetical protein
LKIGKKKARKWIEKVSLNSRKSILKTTFSSYGEGLYEAELIPYLMKILFEIILHPKEGMIILVIFPSKIIINNEFLPHIKNREEKR